MKFQRLLTIAIIVLIIFFSAIVNNTSANDNVSKPVGMIFIPSGEFFMGSTEKDGKLGYSVGVDEVPKHIVKLKAFYMDKYEVSNRLYKEFVDSAGHKVSWNDHDGPYSPYSWKDNFPLPGQEDLPVTSVSWYDADEFCKWSGKRLPTEEEWEMAARGTDGRQWPFGNNLKEGQCNTKYADIDKILPVGGLSKDVSPYGVYDMCGNVSEWTSSWYLPYKGSSLKRDSFGEKYKVVRGGSWVMPAIPYSRAAYRANTYPPEFKHRGIGFRCVKDVDEK